MIDENSQNPPATPLGALFADGMDLQSAGGRELPVEKKTAKSDFNKVANTIDPFTHEFLNRRIVRITGPITDAKASQVISYMQFLSDLDPDADIELRINSPGGSVTAGLAIYDAMKALNCDVKTTCEGVCASMAAVLLAAGTPGKRVAMPSSTIMVHGVSGGMEGTMLDMVKNMDEMKRLQNVLTEILSQSSGMPANYVQYLMERDNFMSPADAKKLGLIDQIHAPRHQPPVQRAATSPIPMAPPPLPGLTIN